MPLSQMSENDLLAFWRDLMRIMPIILVQAYAERAKKVNEDKEKEEARREAERIRFVLKQFP